MTIQIIKTQSGDDLIVLPKAEYERLVALAADGEEEQADILAYDQAKMSIAGSATLPGYVSEMMLNGASLLRALRKWRRMTQVELSEKAGIRQGYVSDIEVNRRRGSTETLQALAMALDVPSDWLL